MGFEKLNYIDPGILTVIRADSRALNMSKGMSYGRRQTLNYEFDYIISSDEGRFIIDDKEIIIQPKTLYLRRPGLHVEGIATYTSFYIILDIPEFGDLPFNDVIAIKNFESFELALDKLYNAYIDKSPVSDFIIKSTLSNILLQMYEETISHQANVLFDKRLVDALEFINSNFNRNISLDDIVSHSKYSKYRLCHIMSEELGMAPMTYLMKCRMSYVCKQLIETRKSIKEIIYDSGYKNSISFFRIFKKYTGLTPLEYREKNSIMNA